MKNKFTKNLGLKIVSVLAAFFLWLVVVNVDNPVISRTYSGIEVTILNDDVVEKNNQCYEILDNTNYISVVITAQRSVLDEMSADYIKATADFRAINSGNRLPIDLKSTRYADKIESISTRSEYVKVALENIVEKPVPVMVSSVGEVEQGHILAEASARVGSVLVRGPESIIQNIVSVNTEVDVTDLNKDATVIREVVASDKDGDPVSFGDEEITIEPSNVEIQVLVNQVKEIPITCGYEGEPALGYAVAGPVMTSPSSVLVTGRGENYDDMDVIYISPNLVSVDGVTTDVTKVVDISEYLPTGVMFADKNYDTNVNVSIDIEETKRKVIAVPTANIAFTNIPDGYVANLVDIGGYVNIEIQGLGDTFERYSGDLAIGSIDATTLVPRDYNPDSEGAPIQTGENDGTVVFDLPSGINLTGPVSMMVIVDYVGDYQELLSGDNVTSGATDGVIADMQGTNSEGASDSVGTNVPAEQN